MTSSTHPKVDCWQWAFILAIRMMTMPELESLLETKDFPEAPADITEEKQAWCFSNLKFVIKERRNEKIRRNE